MEKERRILKLEVIERNAGAVRFKIAEQSHRNRFFANNIWGDGSYFDFNGQRIGSFSSPAIGSCGWEGCLFVRGFEGRDEDELYCSEEIYDKKIVPAVQAYNDTNGGFGFDNVCPTCGQEIKDWKPEKGEVFYYVSQTGAAATDRNHDMPCDNYKIDIHNAFKTEELAQIAAEKVKEVLKAAKHS